ncbi:hypothetical protein UR09_05340 [Candidatus Nitromaritima sp. SCGC AAA799-A02]|nr:hypothetical protein UR09_05340 [Candidatus Nitromaritima sp. SCGC AAA799-A02]
MWLGLTVSSAWAQDITSVPVTGDKARVAVAPYAQVVPNDSYTFIGVTHPSLDTALTQIGVALEVSGMSTVPNNSAGRASIFTIDAGETHRIFAVNVSHSTINSSNAAFTDARTHLILTQDSAQTGSVKIVSIATSPITPTVVGSVNKYANLSQLSFWGVVFIESSSTGFALEFIGDAHDSTLGRGLVNTALTPITGVTTGAGRGIN